MIARPAAMSSHLVGLKRGVEDACRGRADPQVMTTPFKLSELEIRVECAIGVALMIPPGPGGLFRNAQFAVKQAKARGQAAGL